MDIKTPQIADALEHHQKGRLDTAIRIYDEILVTYPDHGDALHLRGLAAFQKGDLDTAERLIRKAVLVNSGEVNYHTNLGRVLSGGQKFNQAVLSFENAIVLAPDVADIYSDLAAALVPLGRLTQAINSCEKALALNPIHENALGNLAMAYFQQGLEFQQQGKFTASIESYNASLKIKPVNVDAWCNLGNAERELGHFERAIDYYDKALGAEPELATVHGNMGVSLHEIGRLSEAIASYERALKLNPEDAESHRNLAMSYLLGGDFKKGWVEYEWRWKTRYFSTLQRDLTAPKWTGENLKGKTIFVHAEQGYGDTIQFCRYLPLLKERGARVIFECQPTLVELIKSINVDEVISKGNSIPEADFHSPLLSLPGHFKTDISTITPPKAYLFCDQLCPAIKNTEKLNVGIAWRGSPEFKRDSLRSPGLEPLLPLFENFDINFYSLQKDKGKEEIQKFGLTGRVEDVGSGFETFSDTAAAIRSLDLVISSDTAIAHLAGALGTETWTLLPKTPDWRWLLERDDTPWYPKMRLFRQQEFSDWSGIVEILKKELFKKASI